MENKANSEDFTKESLEVNQEENQEGAHISGRRFGRRVGGYDNSSDFRYSIIWRSVPGIRCWLAIVYAHDHRLVVVCTNKRLLYYCNYLWFSQYVSLLPETVQAFPTFSGPHDAKGTDHRTDSAESGYCSILPNLVNNVRRRRTVGWSTGVGRWRNR